MKRTFLFIGVFALIASTLACSLSSLTGPHMVVTLAPESGNQWDEANMTAARDVIFDRLNSIGVRATARISPDGNLQITLPTNVDMESVAPLLTEMGAISFVDSIDGFPAGEKIDSKLKIILRGSDIGVASVTQNSIGGYQIAITFTPEGSQKMADYTSNNIGHYLIIVRDEIVISSPRVDAAITDGNAVISGTFTQNDVTVLAAQLRAKSLPFPLIILDTTTK